MSTVTPINSEKSNPKKSDEEGVLPRVGLGPMSLRIIRAAHEIAKQTREPIMLIASRRQVECEALGGGYVEDWSTEEFAREVAKFNGDGLLWLCRDHGGPYQHESDKGASEADSMAGAKTSLKADIDSGFKVLHLDTSVDVEGEATFEVARRRLMELYHFCWDYAKSVGREDIKFEVGFEAQGVDVNDVSLFREQLQIVLNDIKQAGLPAPIFAVAQTGTKVVEDRNIGIFVQPETRAAAEQSVSELAQVCFDLGVGLKAHNCDYLSLGDIARLHTCGVTAINVAPEFGVVETQAWMALANRLGMSEEHERLVKVGLDSKKWVKWMEPGSLRTNEEKSALAGHYVATHPEIAELRDTLVSRAEQLGIDVNRWLDNEISSSLRRYVDGMVGLPARLEEYVSGRWAA